MPRRVLLGLWAIVAIWSLLWLSFWIYDEHPIHWSGEEMLQLAALIALPIALMAAGQYLGKRLANFLELAKEDS